MPLGNPILAAAQDSKALVLDTNVVLDWLVFQNPASHAVGAAIRSGCVAWWSNGLLRDEFEHVTRREFDRRWTVDADVLAETWAAWAQEPPARQHSAARAPRCRDPDDQKFLDFAVQTGAGWLLTRDRDLLVLRRRVAIAHDVQIVTPEQWLLRQTNGTSTDSIDVGAHSYPQKRASI